MNRVYRLVWNAALGSWNVASERARPRGKGRGACTRKARRARALSTLAVVAALSSTHALAADLYWDVNGTTAGLGGSGFWNLANSFWGLNSDGTSGAYSIWNNLALDN